MQKMRQQLAARLVCNRPIQSGKSPKNRVPIDAAVSISKCRGLGGCDGAVWCVVSQRRVSNSIERAPARGAPCIAHRAPHIALEPDLDLPFPFPTGRPGASVKCRPQRNDGIKCRIELPCRPRFSSSAAACRSMLSDVVTSRTRHPVKPIEEAESVRHARHAVHNIDRGLSL